MIITHNMDAMNTQRQYNIIGVTMSKSTEKLSSGFQINRSADDAAGLSISEKMRKQIRGLDRGCENIQDGISWVQIGDGAMEEAGQILLRMEELAVQSANGTNSESDRQAIDAEIRLLKKEINRISRATKFNQLDIFDRNPSMILDVEGATNDLNFFNASYDSDTGELTYGGFLFHERRIHWDEIDPNMVYMEETTDSDGNLTGQFVQKFRGGSYSYTDSDGYMFHIQCSEGADTPQITRDFKIEASAFGIRIDEQQYGWNQLLDEDGQATKDGTFHEGVWSLDYFGAKVNFVLLEDKSSYYAMGESIEELRTGRVRYQWTQHTSGSVNEKAVDVDDTVLSRRQVNSYLAAAYEGNSNSVLRVRADEDGIWLESSSVQSVTLPGDPPETVERTVWSPVAGNRAATFRSWEDLSIRDWNSGGDIRTEFTYTYIDNDGVSDTNYTFNFNLSNITSKDSVIDGLDGMLVENRGMIVKNHLEGVQLNAGGPILSMRMSTNGSNPVRYVEERLLGRNFDQETQMFKAATGDLGTPSGSSLSKPIKIDFKDNSGNSVLTYTGDARQVQSQMESHIRDYIRAVSREMERLVRNGGSSSDYFNLPNKVSSVRNYSFTYRTSDGRALTATYDYDLEEIARRLSVVNEPAGSSQYVTKYGGNTINLGDPTALNSSIATPYAELAISNMVKGFQVKLYADDYTYISMQTNELPNTAVRTTFEPEVLRTVRPTWDVGIQCSGDDMDKMLITRFALDVYALGIHTANARTEQSSTAMIDQIGEAQKYLSSKRSLYGAYQNRLEHTYAIRAQMEEDTTSAESMIRDTDMAKEVVNHTKQKILQQAGQSLLAQANQTKQGVIRLLA